MERLSLTPDQRETIKAELRAEFEEEIKLIRRSLTQERRTNIRQQKWIVRFLLTFGVFGTIIFMNYRAEEFAGTDLSDLLGRAENIVTAVAGVGAAGAALGVGASQRQAEIEEDEDEL